MAEKTFEKDELQEAAIEALVSAFAQAGINGSGTGAGKTYVGIKAALLREEKRVLIIGQPKTFENFAGTLSSLTNGELELRPCANAKFRDGTPAAEAKANKEAAMRGDDGWFFVSRELFAREMTRKRESKNRKTGKITTRKETFRSWCKNRPFDYVIYDECQMMASRTSNSAKAVRKLQTDFLLVQSADWFGGEIINQWHVAKTLWPSWLESEYPEGAESWIDDNCIVKYDHFSPTKQKIVGEQWPGFFASTLPLYVRIPSPIEKPEPEEHYIDLSREERRLYDELRKNLGVEIGDELLVVQSAAELHMRLREASLGVFVPRAVMRKRRERGRTYEIEGQTVEYQPGDKSSTVDEIRSIMKDHPGEPVIVLSGSRKWAEKAAADLEGLPYTGKQTDAQKAEAERAFMAGEIKVLVGTEAMCEGLDGLQKVCRTAIIASRPGKNYMTPQFIGRIARRGQEREPQVFEIVRRNTIDTRIERGKKSEPGIVARAIAKEIMLNGAKSL